MATATDDPVVARAVAQAQAALDEDTAAIEAWFEVRDGWPAAVCETGEMYVTYALGGPKKEYESAPAAKTPGEAFDMWRKATADLRREQPAGTRLYWRRRPQIEFFDGYEGFDSDDKVRGWKIRARLCVTTKPELPATDPWRQSIEESISAAENA